MSEAIRAEAELLRQKNIAKYGPEAVARCGGSGGRGPPGPPGPPSMLRNNFNDFESWA